MGDIVLTTPVIRAIKTNLDGVSVHFATKQAYATLLEANPYVDHVHVLRSNLYHLIRILQRENFSLVIDLHLNLRSIAIRLALNRPSHSLDKDSLNKLLWTKLKIKKLKTRHIVDKYMDALLPLGITGDTLGLDHFIPEGEEMDVHWLPPAFHHGYVAFAIGGKYQTKRLPLKRLIELCDRISKPVVLIGGEAEASDGESLESFFDRSQGDATFEEGLKALGKNTVVYNACGKLTVHQSASLIKQARWVFAHDTGMMHIAAAFKKEIFSIWGNTVPEFGMYPYRTKFTIFEKKSLKCRPCSHIGYQKCPQGHFKCMNEINFDFYLPD